MTEINKIIEEAERLLAEATPGRLTVVPRQHTSSPTTYRVYSEHDDLVLRALTEPDARLFAAAPAALRALVDEVERLRKQVAQLEFDRTAQPNADWEPNSKTVADWEKAV